MNNLLLRIAPMVALATLCACQPLHRPESERAAANAAGLGEAIVFRTDPGSIDAEESIGDTLSLIQAIQLSAMNDPRIQAALSRVRMAEADAGQARLLPNPILNLSLRLPSGGGKTTIEAGIAAELLSVLQQPGRVSAADARLRAEAASAVETVIDVIAEVRERYVEVQSLDELLTVHAERRSVLDRHLDVARARFNGGEATALDVSTLQAQRLELEMEFSDVELQRREARLQLAKLIGQPSAEPSWALAAWDDGGEIAGSEKQWIDLALRHRPQITAREYELQALGAERQMTKYAPFGSVEAGIDAEREEDWSIGPAVATPIPVFDTGQAARARASAAVVEARHKLQEAQREAIEETRRAYAAYVASKSNLRRLETELIPLQQQRLRQAEAQYQAGQTDITTLFLAEQDFRTARLRVTELRRRVSESLIRLERCAGGAGVVRDAFPSPSTTRSNP